MAISILKATKKQTSLSNPSFSFSLPACPYRGSDCPGKNLAILLIFSSPWLRWRKGGIRFDPPHFLEFMNKNQN